MRKVFFLYLLVQFTWFFLGCNNSSSISNNTTDTLDKSKENVCIEKVIATDSSLADIRNGASKNISLSQAIQDYVKGIERIDFKHCPEEFTNAFTKHKEAWIGMLPITNKYSTLRGEMHHLFEKLEQSKDGGEFKLRLKLIFDTWADVEKTMKKG